MRSLIFFVSTAAMLLLAYSAYNSVMHTGITDVQDEGSSLRDLPAGKESPRNETILISSPEIKAQLPGSQKFEFTKYDPRSNRAVAALRGDTWRKVPDSADRIEVKKPELELLLPSGMVATITAELSQLKIENLAKQKMEPQFGWLEGQVAIRVRRDGEPERGYARPEDGIVIETERLDFNLELGELKTDKRLRAHGDLFDIHGIGLNLVWNRIENKLELLSIDRGEHMMLWLEGGLSGDLRQAVGGEQTASQPAAAEAVTTAPASDPLGVPRRPRAPTTYVLRLEGGVFVDHIQDEVRKGGMEAEYLELLFDLGGRLNRAASQPEEQTSKFSAGKPNGPPLLRERIEIAWNGRLALGPAAQAVASNVARRQVTAVGEPLVLDMGGRQLLAGKLEYHDETQRLWLSPLGQERIALNVGRQMTATSESIYIDRKRNLVKLIGETVMRARESASADPIDLRCDLWAELRLPVCEAPGEGASDALTMLGDRESASGGTLESALLVGNARIGLQDQSLRAEKIETWFSPRKYEEQLPELIERVVAAGEVRLASSRAGAGPQWWQFLTAKVDNPLGAASGQWRRASQAIQCGWLEMNFARDASRQPYAEWARALGAVRLVDREHDIAARGRELTAAMGPGSELRKCIVQGDASQPARIQSSAFDVRGKKIEVDPIAETLDVPGESWLRFMAASSLRGELRVRAQPVIVTATEKLRVDNKANEVRLTGSVDARSGEERLQARTLILTLGDVAKFAAGGTSTLEAALEQGRKVVGEHFRRKMAEKAGKPAQSNEVVRAPRRGLSPTLAGTERGGVHKEPLRLNAREALLTSESFAGASDSQPAVHQSVQAAEMDFDVKQRLVRTTGETVLGMIDRRLASDERSIGEVSGMPAALMSRGPSLTHIRCKQSMVYQLGKDGVDRNDAVLFEGEVAMRHFAGRELLNLPKAATIFPQVVARPESLDKFKSRYTELNCDRLGGFFEAAGDKQSVRTLNRSQPAMRLSSLNADGRVFLRDEQRPVIREVWAAQVEFDRAGTEIGIYGQKGGEPARIKSMNIQTQRYDEPYVGDLLTIDLANNTVRTGPMRGSSNRN